MIYLVHEFARRAPQGIDFCSFDPLMVPGTGLARESPALMRAAWHTVSICPARCPGPPHRPPPPNTSPRR